MSKNNSGKKLAVGAAVGVVAGFVAGILTAPKSGKETREDIKNTANNLKREAEKKLKQLHGELSELIKKGKDLAKKEGAIAKEGLAQALEVAQEVQQKVKIVISAIKNGETDEPELKQAIEDATKAKNNLVKYLKK